MHMYIIYLSEYYHRLTYRFNAFKLLPLLDLLQFAYVVKGLLLEVQPHDLYLAVCLKTRRPAHY